MKKKVAIIGLGLIGGSLALALRKRTSWIVVGVSRNRSKIKEALKRGAIHEGFTDLKKGVQNADLVVVCTPVRNIPGFVQKIDQFLPKHALITDVGSTKSEIIRQLSKTRLKHIFVGSHPMAGSHHTGLKFAKADLYVHSTVFITPTSKTPRKAVNEVVKLWKSVGARLVLTTPDKHDQIVASISHLPHVLAFALASMTPYSAMQHCGNGFRDMTRLAQSDAELWRDIFMSNIPKINQSIAQFEKELQYFKRSFSSRNEKKLLKRLRLANSKRQRLSFS